MANEELQKDKKERPEPAKQTEQKEARSNGRAQNKDDDAKKAHAEAAEVAKEVEDQKEAEPEPSQRIVVVEHSEVTVPHEKADQPEQKQKIHTLKFRNKLLNLAIIEGVDGKSFTLLAKGVEYTLVNGKPPLLKDRRTGRTMVRVVDPANASREKMYDPLSGKLLTIENRDPDPVNEQVGVTAPEKYAEKISDTLAEKLDEEVRVPVGYLAQNAARLVREMDMAKLGDAMAGKRIVYVDYVEIDEHDERVEKEFYKTLVVEAKKAEEQRQKAREEFAENVDYAHQRGIKPEEKPLAQSRTIVDIADYQRRKGQNADAASLNGLDDLELEESIAHLKNAQGTVAAYHVPDLDAASAPFRNFPGQPAIENIANALHDLSQEDPATSASSVVNSLQGLRDRLNNITPDAASSTAINDLDRAIRRGITQAEAAARTERGQQEGGEDDLSSRWRRQEKRDLKRESYYEAGAGTIPTVELVGFKLSQRYSNDKGISYTEVVDYFREEFNELTESASLDHAERIRNNQMYVDFQKQFDTGNYRLHYIGRDRVPGQTGKMMQAIMLYKADGKWNDDNPLDGAEVVRVFRSDDFNAQRAYNLVNVPQERVITGHAAEQQLILAQYAELKHQQMEWMRRELEKVATTATSDDDLRRMLGHLRRSENEYLDININERIDAITILYTAKVSFKDGLEGLKRIARPMRSQMHYLMQLPGVAELMGEIEDREYGVIIQDTNGWQKRRKTKEEQGRAEKQLRKRDREIQVQIKRMIDNHNPPQGFTEEQLSAYLDPDVDLSTEAAKQAFLADDEQGYGGMNLTSTKKADDPDAKEFYFRVRRGLMRGALHKFLGSKEQDLAQLERERVELRAQGRELEALAKEREISTLENQRIDQTSVEVAEWIWRISGRAALYFDRSYEGQYQQFQINNQGMFALQKQRNWDDKDVLRLAYGAEDYDQGRSEIQAKDTFLPGIAGGYNLTTAWYDYFTNYTNVFPNNMKDLLYKYRDSETGEQSPVIEKYVSPEVKQTIERLYQRIKGGEFQHLSEREVMGRLTQEERDHVQLYHQAVTLHISTDSWRKIKKTKDVWGDWHDMGNDLEAAAKGKQVISNFLDDPSIKNISALAPHENRWYRVWRLDKPLEDMYNTMLDYRTTYNKKNKHIPNWDGDDVDRTITTSYHANNIDLTIKEKLENKQFSKIRGPVLLGKKMRWFEFEAAIPKTFMGLPLRRMLLIWPGKYKNRLLLPFGAFFAGFLEKLGGAISKGVKPPLKV